MNFDIHESLHKIRTENPLILNLTNFVTIEFTANALLALGAAPIMSFEKSEIKELVAMSSGICVNIGTLTTDFMELFELALNEARNLNKIIVFDPVGAGATRVRTEVSQACLSKIHVVRGNASEIRSLVETQAHSHGVDSHEESEAALNAACILAEKHHLTVIVTGKTDLIVTANNRYQLTGGSPLMKKITGMGCALTSVLTAFCAIESDISKAVIAGLSLWNHCGETAEKNSEGPGSFKVNFLDEISKTKMLRTKVVVL